MSSADSTSSPSEPQSGGSAGLVTVKVNLSEAAWRTLNELAERRGVSVTEALQRAIATDKALMDAAAAAAPRRK